MCRLLPPRNSRGALSRTTTRTPDSRALRAAQSPAFPPTSTYAPATFAIPALPADATALSVGLSIYDVGAQLDFSLVMFSNLESTFSVGYATAMQKGRDSSEVMVSLKLLR